jgi:multidrug efflux system membrane fusion protein
MSPKLTQSRPVRPRLAASVAAIFAAAVGAAPLCAHAQAPQNTPVPVTAVRVARQDVPEFTRGIGTVQAYRQVLVRARVDGNLDSIHFREGQDVHPGDLLAEIDPRPYAATLAQAQAHRASDQAQLDNAKRDMARYANLVRTNVASRQQVDTQQALVETDQANLQADDAAIAAAALNLNYCRITAPIEGVVGFRLVDIGNLIHATDSTGIVSITQVHPIALIFTLPQDELPAVRDAMAAQGGSPEVDALAGDNPAVLSRGKLVTINNSIDTQTGTIELKAEFANTDNKLWPGQFVTGRLRLGTVKGALTLPPSAVQHGPDGLYVYLVKPDATAVQQKVTLGYQDETNAVVTDGLQDGDSVVLSGQLRLQPGMKVAAHLQGAS